MKRANYILLDAARMNGEIHQARELNPDHTCLYEGDSEKFLAALAPWLFAFEPDGPFANWLASQGKGNSWGIFLRADVEPVKLYKHLRRYLIVQTDEGREVYFRYYDPRVLTVFLPTCDEEQLKAFFGPISAFVAEDENGLVVEYAIFDGELIVTKTEKEMDAYVHRDDQVSRSTAPMDKQENEPTDPLNQPKPPAKNWDFGY